MVKHKNIKLLMLASLFGFLLVFPFSSANTALFGICGNGNLEYFNGEDCDDGNSINGDGCNVSCFIEAGFECTNIPYNISVCTPLCGNGTVNPGEQCDDGNAINTDSCTNSCQNAICGDGLIQASAEQCDDGNSINTDSCTNSCLTAACGDGYVQGTEQCDDGNAINTDSCTNSCLTATCGDGFVQGTEQCDDGNGINTDSCTNSCLTATCGDGYVQGTEQCDDGNAINTDSCTNACLNTTCGDGFVQGTEECDDGNAINTDSCTNSCLIATCGDGFVQGAEQCDDGNTINTDSCTNSCQNAICGDGLIQASAEQCDDGNSITEACAYGDASCTVCGSSCQQVPGTTTFCGDNILNGPEQCDDGNNIIEDCPYGDTPCNVCGPLCQEIAGTLHFCGDGTKDDLNGEQCDDGNTITEECAYGQTSCSVCGATCSSVSGATSFCGDHIVNGFEECDYDTNPGSNQPKNGDGCSSTCKKESGYTCFGTPNTCEFNCGNETVQSESPFFEQCDEGVPGYAGATAPFNGDACVVSVYGDSCNWCNTGCEQETVRGKYCGDGALDVGNKGAACAVSSQNTDCDSNICDPTTNTCTSAEECDDGNLDNADGCSSCNIDSGYTCVTIAGISSCATVCGDGVCALGSENCNSCNTDCGICHISPPTIAEEHDIGLFGSLLNGVRDTLISPILRIKIPGLDFSQPEPEVIEKVMLFDHGITTFEFGEDVFNIDIINKTEDLLPGEDYVIFKIY